MFEKAKYEMGYGNFIEKKIYLRFRSIKGEKIEIHKANGVLKPNL